MAFLRAPTFDDRGVVLVDRHLLRCAEILHTDVLELKAEVFREGLTVGEDRDVLEHGLAPVSEARCLHRDGVERAT